MGDKGLLPTILLWLTQTLCIVHLIIDLARSAVVIEWGIVCRLVATSIYITCELVCILNHINLQYHFIQLGSDSFEDFIFLLQAWRILLLPKNFKIGAKILNRNVRNRKMWWEGTIFEILIGKITSFSFMIVCHLATREIRIRFVQVEILLPKSGY